MIFIKKPTVGPSVRNRAGQNLLDLLKKELQDLYDVDPISYDRGIKTFEFNSDVYGHSKIKRALIKAQHGKCGFCESNILSISSGDVEHFRPKAGCKQNVKQKNLTRPGYYWLAYEWDNFLLSCERCNRIYKKNLFPLRVPENRCLNHNGNMKMEKPYLINPLKENPKNLIEFDGPEAKGKGNRMRGLETIKYLGLNRSGDGYMDLIEIRRDLFERTKATYKLSKKIAVPGVLEQDDIDEAIALMKKFRSEKYQFSSMIQDNFPE